MILQGETLGIKRNLVQTEEELSQMVTAIQAVTEFSFDTETTSLNYRICQLVGSSFCDGVNAWYIPLAHTTGEEQLSKYKFIKEVKPILEDETTAKICHNFKFDYQVMKCTSGVDIKGQWVDTMLAHWLLDENEGHKLKVLSKKYFGYSQQTFDELTGDSHQIAGIDVVTAGGYACDDAILAYRLMQLFAPKLGEENLTKVFLEVEMPFVRVLGDMGIEGVDIDAEYLRVKGIWVEEEMIKAQRAFFDILGRPINLNSSKQLGEALFTTLKYPVISRTGKGAPSTDADTMEALNKKGYEGVLHVYRYKMLSKIHGTYIIGLLNKLEDDGKLHGQFHQTGTVTGRLSSSEPNLQNIPAHDDETQIKKAFIPPKGHVLINGDYSQIELRVLAHFSQDEAMMDAYNNGRDLHVETASKLSRIPYVKFIDAVKKAKGVEPLNKEELGLIKLRSMAKGVNFGIVYGRGAESLAESENISVSSARKFISDYFAVFKGVREFIDKTHLNTKKYGYVRSLTGRKRRISDIWSQDGGIQASAKRQAVNSKIQGSAGDIMKIAMIKLQKEVLPKYNAWLTIQVHDELLIVCPEEVAVQCMEEVKETMINAVKLRVPLDVDIRICPNWAEGH